MVAKEEKKKIERLEGTNSKVMSRGTGEDSKVKLMDFGTSVTTQSF